MNANKPQMKPENGQEDTKPRPLGLRLLPTLISKVAIVPRGRAMGMTQQLPEREKYIYPREYLLDCMVGVGLVG